MNGPAKATEFGSREHRFGRAFPRAHGGRSADLVLSRSGLWFRKRRFPCTIGRGGVVEDKREGDGGTPSGIHRIVGMLYRADRVARPAPLARTIRPGGLLVRRFRTPSLQSHGAGALRGVPRAALAFRPTLRPGVADRLELAGRKAGIGLGDLRASLATKGLPYGRLHCAPARSPGMDRS